MKTDDSRITEMQLRVALMFTDAVSLWKHRISLCRVLRKVRDKKIQEIQEKKYEAI